MKRTAPLRSDPAKTRAWQDRSRAELKRTPLKKRGRNAHKRFEAAFHSVGFVKWVHSLGCSVPNCQRTDIEAAHVGKPRSRGGRWTEVAPLCAPHHREQEKRTPWFNEKYGIQLEWIAASVAQRWMAWTEDRPAMGPRQV